jgi:hypothetical protein
MRMTDMKSKDKAIAKKAGAPVKKFEKWDVSHDKKVKPGSAKDIKEDKAKAKSMAKRKK